MLKPICFPCKRFFRPVQNGFKFIEGMPIDNDALPGTEQPERWKPYKLWVGDQWQCSGCGAIIIVGAGRDPIAVQHEKDFAEQVALYNATFQVNDC